MRPFRIDEARSKLAHRRLQQAYQLEMPDRIPVVEYTRKPLGYTIRQISLDEACMLDQQLANITETSYYDTDYVPFLEPWICVPIYAEAFGAEVQFFENEWSACKPLIHDNPEDVYRLRYGAPWTSPLWQQLRKTMDYFQSQTGGMLPMAATDPQGPFTNASLLWDTSEFFAACYTNPEEVHHIMRILTDQFIEYYEAQLKIIENPAFPGHSFPLGKAGSGISISDDNCVMISPALFEEFNLPYLSQISLHFGGLYYHSCGRYEHMIDSILKIPKLRAINWHTGPNEMGSSALRKVQGKCAVWTGPSLNETGWGGKMPPIEQVFDEYYIKENMRCGGRGLILAGYGSYYGSKDVPAAEQDVRLAHIRNIIRRYEPV